MVIIETVFISIFLGLIYEGIVRKIAARMQNRVGPPIRQPIIDFVKLLSKERFEVEGSNHALITFISILSVIGLISAVFMFPLVGLLNFKWNFILLIYILVFSTACFILVGFSSSSPYTIVGSTREAILFLAYDLPMIIILLYFAMNYQSLQSLPSNLILNFPLFFISFIMIAQAKLGLPPFHISEADQEITAGYLTESSGFELAMLNLAKDLRIFVMVSLATILFFNPSSVLMFFVLSLIILFMMTSLRVALARFRIDQGFKFLWLALLPLILIDIIKVMLI